MVVPTTMAQARPARRAPGQSRIRDRPSITAGSVWIIQMAPSSWNWMAVVAGRTRMKTGAPSCNVGGFWLTKYLVDVAREDIRRRDRHDDCGDQRSDRDRRHGDIREPGGNSSQHPRREGRKSG
jgi:hypothetical protein